MQTIQEPDVLQQPFCASGDKNTIPSEATGNQLASLAEGFPLVTQQPTTQGGIPPERKDFNGAFNLLSKYNYAIQNGWLPTFKQEVSQAIGGYAEGACLWYMPTEGTYAGQVLMLKSLVANNTYDFTANPDSYIGTYWQVVTSAGGGAAFPLLSFISSDHVLNDASWLRADTFSWQSGNVYSSAYQHLVDDISGITAETETISGTTITFYRATDGHKIVLADQESNVSAIYTATGLAWYYILDTTNQRFKLPRSQYNFVGLRDSVGNYVEESLPNITGKIGTPSNWLGGNDGCIYTISSGKYVDSEGHAQYGNYVGINASLSSSTYKDNAPVQQRATQTYLYFYVGNTVQDQTTIDVGEITEDLNGKADLDLSNVSATGKNTAINWAMPDYENGVTVIDVTPGTYTQVAKDSFVIVFASDHYTADTYIYVSPDNGTTRYAVGRWYNDINSNTKGSSWSFFVPKGWSFTSNLEYAYDAYIYPLKGAQ